MLRVGLAVLVVVVPMLVSPGPAALAARQNDAGGVEPVAIRIARALVDTAVEPREIVGGVPQAPSGPWAVAWYRETGRLGESGNVVMTGFVDMAGVGPSAVWLIDQLQTGHTIDVVGSDGNRYRYRVDSVQNYDRAAAPIAEIFFPDTSEQLLTLFTDDDPFDYSTNTYQNIVVVRAIRQPDAPTPAPAAESALLDRPDGCPVPPSTLDLPLASESYPYLIEEPAPYPDRDQMNVPDADFLESDVAAAIDALLVDATDCSVAVREALTLPDGHVLALVGPAGTIPLDALTGIVASGRITDERQATIFSLMLFVREGDEWRFVAPPPV